MSGCQRHSVVEQVRHHLDVIYESADNQSLANALCDIFEVCEGALHSNDTNELWTQQDIWLITYGNSLLREGEKPLHSLAEFLDTRLDGVFNGVHILPFYPYSSDDGFAVIEYTQVNPSLGDWEDIADIAKNWRLMADLVINHCSCRSRWFDNFKRREHPGADFFIELDPAVDTSLVVRPRTSGLLKPVRTGDGIRHVWCTFGHDQADLNFTNPQVLLEMSRVLKFYLEQGASVIRLDAIAFLWKELGTPCLHHEKTHEVVRLLRVLAESYRSSSVIITETNVPSAENLSYFGNANEAHGVYNFPLPPLLVHGLLKGTSRHLKRWLMTVPPAQPGTFYFNFIASHDGIGLRPVEGLISDEEVDWLVERCKEAGGRVSLRSAGEKAKPYELNISLFALLERSNAASTTASAQRYLCAHAIMLALEGVPGIYIHSVFATPNASELAENTGNNRAINRYRWQLEELEPLIDNDSVHQTVFDTITALIRIRREQRAFHPNALQYTLHLSDQILGFQRESLCQSQTIYCIHNLSEEPQVVMSSALHMSESTTWVDLINQREIAPYDDQIVLGPYEYVWISNA